VEQKKIPPDRPRSARELGSWKEIAHYLGVNVRTAQKWKQNRGLPIRRASGVRGRVSADTSELDAWRKHGRQLEPQQGWFQFQWPLASDLRVELRFVGRNPKADDVELFREYLTLLQRAFSDRDSV
jgi:hypothetical protein